MPAPMRTPMAAFARSRPRAGSATTVAVPAWRKVATLPARDGLGIVPDVTTDQYLWVSNLAGSQIAVLVNPDRLEVERRWQSLEQIRWRIPLDDPFADDVAEDMTVVHDGVVYVVTGIEPERDGAQTWVNVEADALWTRLADVVHVGDFVLTGVTAKAGLDTILSGSGWTADNPKDTGTYSLTATDASTLALLRQWAKVCSRELVFDTRRRTVAMPVQQGSTSRLSFVYGRNLRQIRRRTEPPKATKLWAYGRASLPCNTNGYVTDYSYYTGQGLSLAEAQASYTKEQIWVDETFVDQASLAAAANARLAILAQPTVTYECSVADLSALTGADEARYDVGDTVRVTDTPLGIDVQARVARIVRRPLEPWRNEVELSTDRLAYEDTTASAMRGGLGDSWYLLNKTSTTARTIAVGETLHAVIGVTFVEDVGKATYALHLVGTATGTGTLRVQIYDETNDVAVREQSIPFTAGALFHTITFAAEELSGDYLFSVRAKVTSGTGSVAIAVGGVNFHMMVQGGLGVAVPPAPNSETFAFTGAVQTFTVPPDVTTVNIDCFGASGGGTTGGKGGRVLALDVPVTAGETLDVYVGGTSTALGTSRWPDGGAGSTAGGSLSQNVGGGGSSSVRRSGTVLALAGAGGGQGYQGDGLTGVAGGDGGHPTGSDASAASGGGKGGTQSAGGAAGGSPATAGGALQGGTGGRDSSGGGATGDGGGGGGGWYGGGGGVYLHPNTKLGGGGGGSSYETGAASAVLYESGTWSGDGTITISWAV